ncbi:aldose 1-epimerase [Ideonella sp.]|uniref:aldose 1-epimerase n=1 Tax=Ideonella sp. TaxID=1929293 RepID=UPI002B4703FB|nr:aldose 1-epimerase [Ideonella sp.]HJV68178.1 aldose 1-epimerase [Ideonella sp.]
MDLAEGPAIASNPTSLELTAGELRLALRPDLGGCMAGLWLGDLPVLRSTEPAALDSSRASGCYPLAPYSNRLGFRRFRWQGQDYTTQQNFDDNPHSVHGVAWQRPWSVVSSDGVNAELAYEHVGDAHWPFDFALRQRFELTPESLTVRLHLTNRAALPQPVGLGWHPYFPKRTRSRLHIELTERWEPDASGLPTRKHPQAGIDGDIAHLDFDHCFEGWQGDAKIRDEKLRMNLRSSLPYLVVFTPQNKPYYCVEPVSHVSNAIHMADPMAHGLRKLAPGEAFEAWMTLEVAHV